MAIPDGIYNLNMDFKAVWSVGDQWVTQGSLQFVWTGIDTFDATVQLQGSNINAIEDEYWNLLGNDNYSITLSSTPASQLWEFAGFRVKFIRFVFSHGTNTTGTGQIVVHAQSRT